MKPLVPRFGLTAASVVLAVLLGAGGCGAPSEVTVPEAGPSSSAPATPAPSTPGSSTPPVPSESAPSIPAASDPPSSAPAPSGAPPSSGAGPGASSAPPRPTGPPPATTPVPPTSPGGIDQTVSPTPAPTEPAVDIEEPSQADNGVSVEITSARAITATAEIPGEVAGPAVALAVSARNTSDAPVDVSTTVVTLLDSRGNPGGEIISDPAKPLTGRLAPGGRTTGTYVFTVPRDRRNPVTVNVTLAGEASVLVFEGRVP